MSAPNVAEVFPAGEFLADELDARGWTQADFAEIIGRPAQFVSEIISGKKEITRESAAQIGAAFGTSAQLWLNLQDSYLLWKQSQDSMFQENLGDVKIRAELRKIAPISLLRKRGFIKSTDSVEQKQEVMKLLGGGGSGVQFAARRGNPDEETTVLQDTWAACVRATAQGLDVGEYSELDFNELVRSLAKRVRTPQAFESFQKLFAEVGVKLIYIESFPGGKLDGCAMRVDGTPVIGISGRGKRLDKVLFTLLHESAHILLGHLSADGKVIVDDLSPTDEISEIEEQADELAGELAIAQPIPEIPSRVHAAWIKEHAEDLEVHPIILIGRLQSDSRIPWKTSLVRNAPTVTQYLERWVTPSLG